MFLANLKAYKKLSAIRSESFAKILAPLIREGSSLLDFGCGNMFTAKSLVKKVPNVTITGIDVVKDQNLEEEILPNLNISFIQSDAEKLPFADNSFDVALALAVLHHTPLPEYYLSELKRIIKPTGTIILVEEMYINLIDKYYISFQDLILNKMKKGIPVPLNFKSNVFYLAEFKRQQLNIIFAGSIRPFPTFMHHYVYQLSKTIA